MGFLITKHGLETWQDWKASSQKTGYSLAVDAEHIHAVDGNRARVRNSVKTRETGHGRNTESCSSKQTVDKASVTQDRQVEDRHTAVRTDNVREYARQGRGVVDIVVAVVEKPPAFSKGVAGTLFLGQGLFTVCKNKADGISPRSSRNLPPLSSKLTSHSGKQPGFVDKGNLHNSLPIGLLAIHVELKFLGIKVDDWRREIRHELPESRRNKTFAACGQDAHELFKRMERRALFKVELEIGDPNNVCKR